MLREFRALPTEARAAEMTDGDYLFCILHLWLDEEERLSRLCPSCRAAAAERACPVCGAKAQGTFGVNESFDEARFRALARGERTT